MVRIDCLIFGYRRAQISPEHLSLATSLLLRGGVYSHISESGEIIVRERDVERVKQLFSDKLEFGLSRVEGLYGIYKRTECKLARLIGAIFVLFLCIFSSLTVWDIRIEGNESIPSSAIVHSLAESGFSVGNLWHNSDLSEIERAILESREDISWININRRAGVAYVKIMEKNGEEPSEQIKSGYTNIVASRDGVIEEITVQSGVAVVNVGDAVKAGDLLVSGFIPSELGGGFCYADAEIKAVISESVSVFVPREYDEKLQKEEKIIEIRLKVFKNSINIFKKYGNMTDECVIIEERNSFSLFGKSRLPFEIIKTYARSYESHSLEYTDSELVAVASSRLTAKTALILESADLIKLKTYGEYTEDGYVICSELSYSADIGEQKPFFVEEK